MNTEVGYQPKMRYEVLLKRNSITWVTLDWAHGYCADEEFWLFLRAVLHSLIWLPFLLNRQAFHHMRQIINLEVTVLSEQFSTLQFIILCFHCIMMHQSVKFLASTPSPNAPHASYPEYGVFSLKIHFILVNFILLLLIGSLWIDDFCATTPLDCVRGLLRMLIWALACVAPKSKPLLTAIRWRPRKSRTWDEFSKFSHHTSADFSR